MNVQEFLTYSSIQEFHFFGSFASLSAVYRNCLCVISYQITLSLCLLGLLLIKSFFYPLKYVHCLMLVTFFPPDFRCIFTAKLLAMPIQCTHNSVAFSYTCSCRIHTDAMNNRRTQEDFFRKNIYLSLYL